MLEVFRIENLLIPKSDHLKIIEKILSGRHAHTERERESKLVSMFMRERERKRGFQLSSILYSVCT